MYSLVWITIGIIAYGLSTGIVYTEVTKVNSPPPTDMNEKTVGCLRYREYDVLMIARSGGYGVQVDDAEVHSHPYLEFLRLVEKLKNKEIDGFALDRFTLMYMYWMSRYEEEGRYDAMWREMGLSNSSINRNKDHIKFLQKFTTLVKVPLATSRSYTYGILVKNRDDYLYFKSAAEDLGQTIGREWEVGFQRTLRHAPPTFLHSAKDELYSYSGSYFRKAVIAVGLTVVGICIFGTVYEFVRRGNLNK